MGRIICSTTRSPDCSISQSPGVADTNTHCFTFSQNSSALRGRLSAARASLVNTTKRTLVAQRSFTFERAAGSNADGGVRALAGAGGELADAVVAWAAAGVAQDKR